MMYEASRDVVSPFVAASMLSPWTTLKKLKLNPRKLKDFKHLAYNLAEAEEYGISVSEVVTALAKSLGAETYYSQYEGEGKRHQDIVEHYIACLCDCTPLVPNSHHETCPAVVLVKE